MHEPLVNVSVFQCVTRPQSSVNATATPEVQGQWPILRDTPSSKSWHRWSNCTWKSARGKMDSCKLLHMYSRLLHIRMLWLSEPKVDEIQGVLQIESPNSFIISHIRTFQISKLGWSHGVRICEGLLTYIPTYVHTDYWDQETMTYVSYIFKIPVKPPNVDALGPRKSVQVRILVKKIGTKQKCPDFRVSTLLGSTVRLLRLAIKLKTDYQATYISCSNLHNYRTSDYLT